MTKKKSNTSEIRQLLATRIDILRAMECRNIPPLEKTLSGSALLEKLLEEFDASENRRAELACAKKIQLPPKHYEYARVRVKRNDGLSTTVSLPVPVYQLACDFLPRKTVHAVIRDAAYRADFRARPPSLSHKIRVALAAQVKESSKDPVRYAKFARMMQAIDPKPVKKLSYLEQKARYGTSYKKTYVTVSVATAKVGIRTAVSVTLPFYPRACAILGRSFVHQSLSQASRRFDRSRSSLSRSESARNVVVRHIRQLAA